MSRLSKLLKKLEKGVSRIGKKTGIKQLLHKNRRALSGIVAGGALGPIGGLIGGVSGLFRKNRKSRDAATLADLVERQTRRAGALEGLDREFPNPEPGGNIPDELRGSPIDEDPEVAIDPPLDELPGNRDLPPGTQPGGDTRFEDFQNEHPELFDADGNFVGGSVDPRAPIAIDDPRGGLHLGRDPGGQREAKILAEAELAQKLQLEQLGAKKASRAASLKSLSELLTQRGEREFSEISPQILEDLNSRGLLRSSALGDRFAKERGRIESRAQEQISLQALQDRQTGLGESTGVLDQFLGSRQQALGGRFSIEDFNRQIQASKLLGQAVAPITPFNSGGKGGAGDIASAAQIVGSLGQTFAGFARG